MANRNNKGEETEVTREFSGEPDATALTEVGGPGSQAPVLPAVVERRFEAGTVLAERYRVVSRLGKGGMGEVYLADDLKLDQQVALKFLPPEVETDEYRLKLLFDEVKVALKISHPNCCRVFDLGEADGVHFLSMEYIDGEDLSSLLSRIGRLPWEKAVELGRQACEGLAAAHDEGILHRDLKPANLMIDGQGRAKLTDFGLAALSDSISGAAVRSGTPAYMAPEQLAGTEVTVQSDIYALGLLLYELFTGQRTFGEASSFAELINMHQKVAPKPPSAWVESIDPAVERILLQCLEKDPKARPASAREVADALSREAEVEEGTQLRVLVTSRLVGGARTVERLGDAAGAELMSAYDQMLRDLLDGHSGREIDKGETQVSLFERPWDAVRFAQAYHRELAKLSERDGVELSGGVGIHFGDVVLRTSARQEVARGARPLGVEGMAKTTSLRLSSLAQSHQTLLTGAAFDIARRGAVGGEDGTGTLTWLAHGEYEFEGAEESIGVFEVGVEALAPLEAPESSAIAKRVEAEDTILGWRSASGLEIPYRSNWVVREKLGEGGFGEVWLGEHKKTGEERVYKFCYETDRLQSLQREITVFRLLKEEIGLRDDIARILDWNLEKSPYFVEFVHVEGGNLVDWAEGQGGIGEVPLADRLEIVAQVATAMAAAHSVGVLHKDIKPANVLMARDAEGKPKAVLTDFGIGLVTDRERLASKGITVLGLTEMDVATDGVSTAGTQIYMAPELLAGKPSTIQADIYALGVMLYQVAVGELDRPMAQGWKRHIDDEMLREDIAACVDGTPSRRPGNAAVVAEWLRTVEERRAARQAEQKAAAAAERAVRRRKVLTTVAAVASVFLVVVSFLAIQAERARGEAERRRVQAEQLMDFMLNDLHEGLEKIGRLDLLESVARGSQKYFDTLPVGDETRGDVHRRGVTLLNIGEVLFDQGDPKDASSAFDAARELFEAAAANEPGSSEWRSGISLGELGLGTVLRSQGDSEAAMRFLASALERAEGLVEVEPKNLTHQFSLGRIYYQIALLKSLMGDNLAAVEAVRRAVEVGEQLTASKGPLNWRHKELEVNSLLLLGSEYRARSELGEAFTTLSRARQLAEDRVAEDPGNSIWIRQLATIRQQLGMVLSGQGESSLALASFRAAGASYRELAAADPTRVRWRTNLGQSLQLICGNLIATGNPSGVPLECSEALSVFEGLVSEDPTNSRNLDGIAKIHGLVAGAHRRAGNLESWVESLSKCRDAILRRAEASPGDPRAQNDLAWNHVLMGRARERQGVRDLARAEWLLALEVIEPVTSKYPEKTFLDTQAQALLLLGRPDDARPLVEDLLEQGWNDREFLTLVRDSGLASVPQRQE